MGAPTERPVEAFFLTGEAWIVYPLEAFLFFHL